MNILERAAIHRNWLAQRQSVVAENIANSSTPGYAARSVGDFGAALAASSQVAPATTNSRHIGFVGGGVRVAEVDIDESAATTHSGNSVDLEKELMSAGEVKSLFSLNVSIVKAFNRMLQSSVRS